MWTHIHEHSKHEKGQAKQEVMKTTTTRISLMKTSDLGILDNILKYIIYIFCTFKDIKQEG